MNVLLTGGAGYIGSTLIKQLVEENHQVFAIDNFSRGVPQGLLKDLRNPRLEFIVGDICDPERLEGIIQKCGEMDVIVHLAAISELDLCQQNPEDATLTNVYGTYNVLETARKNDVKVVFTSSAAVYGNPIEVPIRETHATNPTNLYGVTKLAGEKLLAAYHQSYGVNTVVLRFGNVYGVGAYSHVCMHWESVIPKFITQALRGHPLTIYGDGDQSRDFIHLCDIIRAIELVVEGEQHRVAGETYNVSTGTPTSVNTIATMITKIMNEECERQVKTTYLPPRRGEPYTPNFCLSPNKINKDLGFKPQWNLEKGIKQLIKHI